MNIDNFNNLLVSSALETQNKHFRNQVVGAEASQHQKSQQQTSHHSNDNNNTYHKKAFRDSDALKKLCQLRWNLGNCQEQNTVAMTRELTKNINLQRGMEKKAHADWLCTQLAEQKWHYKFEVHKFLKHDPGAHATSIVDSEGIEVDMQEIWAWPAKIASFWSGVYIDHAYNAVFVQKYLANLCLQVTSLCMMMQIDNTFQPVFNSNLLGRAVSHLKRSKCADKTGLTAKIVKCLAQDNLDTVLELFENRVHNVDMTTWHLDTFDWRHIVAILIAKTPGVNNLSQFRPIHLLQVIQKLYH